MLLCNSFVFVMTHKHFIWLIKGVLTTMTLIKQNMAQNAFSWNYLKRYISMQHYYVSNNLSLFNRWNSSLFQIFIRAKHLDSYRGMLLSIVRVGRMYTLSQVRKLTWKYSLSIKTITHVKLFLLTISHCILIDGTIHRLSLVSHFIV